MGKIVICIIGMCFLVACGRVSKPVPPEGSVYPYPYVVTQDP